MTSVVRSVADRLAGGKASDRMTQLVMAAFAGPDAIDRLIAEGVVPEHAANGAASAPVGAYLTELRVEGFRGIGPRAVLEVPPGPGLTLVVGRNGSGKSSFAEALEVLLTGDNERWARRSAVWREGWRNLHHGGAAIEAELAVEGTPGPTAVTRTWPEEGDIDDGTAVVQPHGGSKADLGSLGWEEALDMHRPFLSYSELGSMLDEGPTKLHDAVASVLGLDDLTAAEKTLRDARLVRAKAKKELLGEAEQICELLEGVDDERARRCVAALRTKEPGLDVIEETLKDTGQPGKAAALDRLRRVSAVDFPEAAAVEAIATELTVAHSEVAEMSETESGYLLRAAELLEQAVALRAISKDETCPVCATPGVLTEAWARDTSATIEERRLAAHHAEQARKRLSKAEKVARGLISSVPAPVQGIRDTLDVDDLIAAWGEWVELDAQEDLTVLAKQLGERGANVRKALDALKRAAEAEVKRREDAWRPVALNLALWLNRAREADQGAAAVPDLKRAEDWLKREGTELRNERFAPIADEAQAIWRLLRQNSNVELGRIEFEGAGVRRRVTLDVTVDGVAGAALGVMSQGELHALALSLFFPRATLDESPFRFVVIDDPVQSMDPSKVDGLAKVLERAAGKRQVVVFTHDDRLPDAIRRLRIAATVLEVTRREGSLVEVRSALTPVERHIEDARALVRTKELPEEVSRRVVPGFCRLALEAAAMAVVRRRRIGRGEPHADVEDLLGSVNRLTVFVALALFDDGTRGGDVLARLQADYGPSAASVFKKVNVGAHQPAEGDLRDLVRDAGVLARQIEERP